MVVRLRVSECPLPHMWSERRTWHGLISIYTQSADKVLLNRLLALIEEDEVGPLLPVIRFV